jgi:phosphoserine phosphatase RsbU/P
VTAGELAGILIGAALAVLGCAAALASLLRPRRGIQLLLAFGFATGLYGIRLLASQAPVRTTLGETWIPWPYFISFVTYLINVPLTCFVEGIIGPGWKNSTRWVRRAVIAFALTAILIDLASARPGTASVANSWLVLVLVSIALGHGLYMSRIARVQTVVTDRIVVLGAAVFAAFVVNENIGQPVAPGTNIEPIGMLVFVLCLGYAVVRTVFRSEADFAGVQRELDTARRIQTSLLPRQLPRLPTLDVAVRFVPMTAVAGDVYDTEVVPFRPGNRLLLYSDGVLEARDRAGQFFDGDRVARWLSDIERASAEQFAEAALGELSQWAGGRFDDDVTFVITQHVR